MASCCSIENKNDVYESNTGILDFDKLEDYLYNIINRIDNMHYITDTIDTRDKTKIINKSHTNIIYENYNNWLNQYNKFIIFFKEQLIHLIKINKNIKNDYSIKISELNSINLLYKKYQIKKLYEIYDYIYKNYVNDCDKLKDVCEIIEGFSDLDKKQKEFKEEINIQIEEIQNSILDTENNVMNKFNNILIFHKLKIDKFDSNKL